MKRILFVGVGLVLVVLPAAPASAHPLGNFSVNQLHALALYPDRIDLRASVDVAELPTVQEKSTVDRSGDGTADAAELRAYAERACADLAGKLDVAIDSDRLRWSVKRPTFLYQAGSAGLPTSRLDCELTASADLSRARTVRLDNHYMVDRAGWREIIATGDGVRLIDPPVPAVSRSGGDLRSYPERLLASPPDVRSVALRVAPGSSSGAAASGSTVDGSSGSWATRLVSSGERRLDAFVGERGQGPLVGLLAVLLALTLGAAHAALPGHGKTIMAAYLAGRRGRARDAVAVGGVVTATHTGGVLAVGLLLTTVAGLVGEAVLGWLGVVSGSVVVGVGAAMLVGLRRRRGGWLSGHGHSHGPSPDSGQAHSRPAAPEDGRGSSHGNHVHTHDRHRRSHGGHSGDGHQPPRDGHQPPRGRRSHGGRSHDGRSHDDGHSHGGHEHSHDGHQHDDRRPSRLGIAGIGIAGGLVPSPSALIVLLGAIALGRTWFGVLLVLAYGLGMAATLTAAGLALVGLQGRWAARTRLRGDRWKALAMSTARFIPSATGSLVLIVGIGLVGRAAATLI